LLLQLVVAGQTATSLVMHTQAVNGLNVVALKAHTVVAVAEQLQQELMALEAQLELAEQPLVAVIFI
jgi:hypothetical protein